MNQKERAKRVRQILAKVKPLAVEYYKVTGKPLGVTGEIAEYVAAQKLRLKLVGARQEGFDATRGTGKNLERIQIKGRAYGENAKPGQRIGKIKADAKCDVVLFVLLDNATLKPRQMWEAPMDAVRKRLRKPGSKARTRGTLGVREFTRLGQKVWPK